MKEINLFEQSDKYRVVFDIDSDNRNFTYCKIYAPSDQLYRRVVGCLQSSFTFDDPGAAHSWDVKNGFSDGKVALFNKSNHSLELGLVTRAYKILHAAIPELVIEFAKPIWDIFKKPGGNMTTDEVSAYIESLNIYNIPDDKKMTPYEHQVNLVEKAINGRRISIVACTSSGKSLSQYVISRYLNEVEKKKVLLVVPSSGLVEQMYSDFKNDYGWREIDDHCTLIYMDSKDKLSKADKTKLAELNLGEEVMLKDVVISTWQSLLKKPLKFFECFGAVLVDEAHGSKADELKRIINQCVNAQWKIGVSGTIPDNGLDAALIEGSLGRREVIVKTHELIAKGILTPVEIHVLGLPYEPEIRTYLCARKYAEEYSLIIGNGSRKKVVDVMVEANHLNINENNLMLFKRKESIDAMEEYFAEKYPQFKIYVIKGEVPAITREQYRKAVNAGTGAIILATYGTMKQGVNIKFLHNLFFMEFSKSMYEIVQSIGRVVRFHPLKKLAKVYDVVDDASYITRKGAGKVKENYAMKHYRERQKYYAEEQFPVIEYLLPITVTVDPADLDRKEKEAEKTASKRKKVEGKGKKSMFSF